MEQDQTRLDWRLRKFTETAINMINPQNPVIGNVRTRVPETWFGNGMDGRFYLHQNDPDLGIIKTADGALA